MKIRVLNIISNANLFLKKMFQNLKQLEKYQNFKKHITQEIYNETLIKQTIIPFKNKRKTLFFELQETTKYHNLLANTQPETLQNFIDLDE